MAWGPNSRFLIEGRWGRRCHGNIINFSFFSAFKGSVERSSLPWAIFLIFTRNRPVWRSPLQAVFYWIVKEKSRKKWKNTASFVASLGAGVQPRSTVQLFMFVSGVENRRFRSFFSALGVIWRGKAFRGQQCQFLTRNKSLSSENESICSMTSECVRTDSILPRGAGLEHGRYKQSIFSLSIFGILVKRLSF